MQDKIIFILDFKEKSVEAGIAANIEVDQSDYEDIMACLKDFSKDTEVYNHSICDECKEKKNG